MIFATRRQLIAGHLLIVAYIEPAVRDNRMVPSLAFDRLEFPEFFELLRIGGQENGLAHLGEHEQESLLGQEQHLAVSVTTSLPAAIAGFGIDAGEDSGV